MKRFLLSTLRGKLIFSFLGVALLPILLLAYINKQTTQKTLTANANQTLLNAANQTAFSLDAFIFNNLDAIRVEAQLPEIISYASEFSNVEPDDKDEMEKIFNVLSSKDSLYILSYSLFDRQGRNILDTNSANVNQNRSQADYFQRPFQTGLPYVSPLRIEPKDKVASFYFSSPVRTYSGKIVGVLAFRYNAIAIQRIVTQSSDLVNKKGSFAILLDENHIRLAQAHAPELAFKSMTPLPPEQVKVLQRQGRLLNTPETELSTHLAAFKRGLNQLDKSPFFKAPIDGTDRFDSVAVVRLRTQPWYVVFVQPQAAFLAPIQAQTRSFLCLALVIAAIVVVAAAVVGQRLTAPLTQLTKAVSRFTMGDTTVRMTIRSEDEIGLLAASFNTMAMQVGTLVLGLEERTQELEVSQSVTAAVSELSCAIREPERLLQEAIALMQNRFGLHYVQIYLLHPATQQLVRWAGSGKQDVMPSEDTLIGFEEIETLIVQAAQTQEIVWEEDSLSGEIGSEVAVPLMARGKLLGVLDLQNDPNYRFKWEDLETFNTLAGQIAIALDNARLFAEVQKAETQYREKATELENTLLELQQTQAQLIQTEKMSSLGQLVAGVAHEINNPVNFIYGNLAHVSEYTTDLLALIELYQEQGLHDGEIRDRIEEIDLEFLIEDLPKTLSSMKIGADRIRSIVLTLRNFSRLDEADMKLVNLHEGIDSTLLILQNRLKARPDRPGIEIIKNYGDLPEVECYAGQLNQVFMNIINNAIDALYEYQNSLDNTSFSPAIAITTQLQPDSVWISIKDNGAGMNELVKSQLFNPFFTTKEVGEGTGLGLSISYQIVVDKHRGKMKCNSTPGEGAEFILEIPLRQHQPSFKSKTKLNAYLKSN